MSTPAFAPTHRVPDAGVNAWAQPIASPAPEAALDPGLEVVVAERRGDWARIICSNGWSAWTDARVLIPITPQGPGPVWEPPQAVVEPESAAPFDATPDLAAIPMPRDTRRAPVSTRVLAIAGAALAVAGSFMPWVSLDSASVNAWSLPLLTLYSQHAASGGIPTGALLAATAIVIPTAFAGETVSRVGVLAAAAIAINAGVAGLLLALRAQPRLTPGAGLVLALAGGVVVAASLLLGSVPRREPA